MPIDFPNSPTSGQTYTVGAITWQWDGSTWKALGSSNPGRDYVSATAPSSPAEGARWLNSNDLKTYTYYDSQWIESSPNLKGETGLQGQPAGNNVVINGAFDFWQRGTSSSTGGYTTADRWKLSMTGNPFTISRQTFTPGAAPVSGYEGQYYYNVTLGGNHQNGELQQNIENARTLAGQTVTLSFWARSTVGAQTMNVQIYQHYGTGGSPSSLNETGISSTYTPTATWTRYTFTGVLPSVAGKTFGTNNDSYLWMRIGQFTTTATNTSLDIWGVQLEAGSVATPFRRNGANLQAELAACQRYYYRVGPGGGSYSSIGSGPAYDTGNLNIIIPFPVTMRSMPTSIDLSAYSTYLLENSGTYNTNTPTTVTMHTGLTNSSSGTLNVQKAGSFNTGYNYKMMGFNTTSAYVGFSAEL